MTGKKITSILMASAFAAQFCLISSAHSNETSTGAYNQNAAPPAPAPAPAPAQQPGEEAPVSTASAGEFTPGGLQNEGIAFQPQFGVVNYRDTLGNVGNRATYGMTMDSNLAHLIKGAPSDFFVGPETGFIYSHIGSGDANFFGSSPANPVGDPGTNMFNIPTNLKIGMAYGNFRPSLHAGANIFYTSSAQSFALGSHPTTGSNSTWSYLPDLGLNLEAAVAKNAVIFLRPEVTFAGSFTIWAASLGASIPLG